MTIPKDKYVRAVMELLATRSDTGLKKYGVNLEREDLSTHAWLCHLQEELLDAANYIEVLKSFFPVLDKTS